MKRCSVCDTSALNSFSEEIGINGPPLYWVTDKNNNDICGYCNDEISETISDDNLEQTIKDNDYDKAK